MMRSGFLVLKVLRAKATKDNRRLLNRIFNDGDLLDIVSVAIEDKWPEVFSDEAIQASSFQDFLQWVLDHQEEIIAFIKLIIEMFAEEGEELMTAVAPLDQQSFGTTMSAAALLGMHRSP